MRAGGIPDASRRRRSRPSPKVRSKKDRSATSPTDDLPSVQSGTHAANSNAALSPASSVTSSIVTVATTAATSPNAQSSDLSEVTPPTTPNISSDAGVASEDQSLPSLSQESDVDMATTSDGDVTPSQGGQVISMQGEQQDESIVSKVDENTKTVKLWKLLY